MQFDAVILAGGLNNGSLAAEDVGKSEALITIGNRPMVEYVINALKHTPEIRKIVVAGPSQELIKLFKEDPELILTESGESTISTLQNGLRALAEVSQEEPTQMVLVTAGDIPMITPEAISNFIALCRKEPGDLYYPVVTREASEHKYPEVKRTYVHLREGQFTGGNLILVNQDIVESCAEMAEKMVARRKNPLALSSLLGLPFVLRFVFRLLSISEVEKKASEILGIRGVAVVSDYPEVGVDVDKISDLQLARRIIGADC